MAEERYDKSVAAPPLAIQRWFLKTLELLWQKQCAKAREVKTLAAIRDALLPKLLSSEVRVKEVESLIQTVETEKQHLVALSISYWLAERQT